MNAKYQVFVSSTYEDLTRERSNVIRAVLEMGHIPVGMEMFSAADQTQWALIQRQIESVDYYVVVIAHRYGSRDGDISYTEKEYDYAVANHVPVLAFIIDDNAKWNPKYIDTDPSDKKSLDRFKTKAKSRMISYWTDTGDLYGKTSISLTKAFTTHPRPGWLPATYALQPEIITELSRLSAENARLRMQLQTVTNSTQQFAEDAYRELTETLLANESTVSYFPKGGNEWKDLPKKTSLLTVFVHFARSGIIEVSLNEFTTELAVYLCGKLPFRSTWPLPSNLVQGLLAQLYSLELVEPSNRKHSASDTNEYWSLSQTGKALWKFITKQQLQDIPSRIREAEADSIEADTGKSQSSKPSRKATSKPKRNQKSTRKKK